MYLSDSIEFRHSFAFAVSRIVFYSTNKHNFTLLRIHLFISREIFSPFALVELGLDLRPREIWKFINLYFTIVNLYFLVAIKQDSQNVFRVFRHRIFIYSCRSWACQRYVEFQVGIGYV